MNWTRRPLTAFCWKKEAPVYPIEMHHYWDCFSPYIDVNVRERLARKRAELVDHNGKKHWGEYMFTLDTCHRDNNTIDTNFSEHDPEHKSFNVIKLDNGQFAAQPNNRVIWTDQSLIPEKRLMPDFKVCSQNYTVENTPKWSVGHTDEWQYKTKDEESGSS